MGLDMYLEKRTYVKNWGDNKKEHNIITIKKGGKNVTDIKPERIKEIVEDVAYWRKANSIHDWFVKNVQDGKDDCNPYYVSTEQLAKLCELCTEVLKSSELVTGKIKNGTSYKNGVETPIIEDGKYIKDPTVAKQLLPTTEGFFFGGTEYDQYYYDDIVYTKTVLEKLLKEKTSGSYYYQSSW